MLFTSRRPVRTPGLNFQMIGQTWLSDFKMIGQDRIIVPPIDWSHKRPTARYRLSSELHGGREGIIYDGENELYGYCYMNNNTDRPNRCPQ